MALFEEEIDEKAENEEEEESKIIFLGSPSDPDDPKIRKAMLYGDVNEQTAKDLIATMILLQTRLKHKNCRISKIQSQS